MARSVLLIFYKELKNALALTAILGFFHTASLLCDLLFPTAAKSKHKFFWKKFEHPRDGQKGEIQDVFHKKIPLEGKTLLTIIRQI